MKNKLFIKSESIFLIWENPESDYALARPVTLQFDSNEIGIIVDERVNEIYPVTNNKFSQLIFILKKYDDLKSTDFRYRTQDGYEGISLKLETFIEFLKQEDRDSQLNKILQC